MAETIFVDTNEITELPLDVTQLTLQNKLKNHKIISASLHLKKLQEQKKEAKEAKRTAETRQCEAIITLMLEAPHGITKAQILAAGESIEFVATLNRYRAYLARNGIYTLKKRKVEKEMLYFLDPIRTEIQDDQ